MAEKACKKAAAGPDDECEEETKEATKEAKAKDCKAEAAIVRTKEALKCADEDAAVTDGPAKSVCTAKDTAVTTATAVTCSTTALDTAKGLNCTAKETALEAAKKAESDAVTAEDTKKAALKT